jgi:hypothetical protein
VRSGKQDKRGQDLGWPQGSGPNQLWDLKGTDPVRARLGPDLRICHHAIGGAEVDTDDISGFRQCRYSLRDFHFSLCDNRHVLGSGKARQFDAGRPPALVLQNTLKGGLSGHVPRQPDGMGVETGRD